MGSGHRKFSTRGGSRPPEAACYTWWFEEQAGGLTVPLYEYQCTKCERRTEKIESVSGPHLKKCPHCGGKVEQTLTAPAIQFKGSGWYVTDYAGKKSAGSDSAPAAKADSNESKDSAAKASEAKESAAKESKEKKPAKKKD
jgi:putative FmdB family regulatory protein